MIVSHDCELLWIEQMQVSMRLRIKMVRYPVWIVALWVIPIECLNLLAQVHELSPSQVLVLVEPLLAIFSPYFINECHLCDTTSYRWLRLKPLGKTKIFFVCTTEVKC